MASDYSPRLSIEISESQYRALQEFIPHGLKRQLFTIIIDDLITLLRDPSKRDIIFMAILNRSLNLPTQTYALGSGVSDEL